jgi:hypothetical protein
MNTLDRIATLTCEICEYSSQRHQWPILGDDLTIANPDGKVLPGVTTKYSITHCSDSRRAGVTGCHRTWISLQQSHCTVCHETFGSNDTSDRHWVGEGRGKPGVHTHPSAIPALVLCDEQFGPVWRRV